MNKLFSLYRPHFATVLVYMLQNVEYRPGPYLSWFWRTQNFDGVMRRRQLERTRPARMLLLFLRTGMYLQCAAGVGCLIQWYWQGLPAGWQIGTALLVSYPFVWAHLVAVPLAAGELLVIRPSQNRRIANASAKFRGHSAIKIAVLGSYGKTSMKEMLATVLAEAKKVAVTPANKNVAISHAAFAATLDGDEDVIILEYGEGKPGDVRRFASKTHPTHAIITGLAPVHLDRYKTLEAHARDLFSIREYVHSDNLFINRTAGNLDEYVLPKDNVFDSTKVLGWTVKDVQVTVQGLSFTMVKRKREVKIECGLLGRHNIAPVAFVVAFALSLGLTSEQVITGAKKIAAFEHRMQPRTLHGATLIDDTYNGNLQGVKAGTLLLSELQARRKWYVTPGLVDQGLEADVNHVEMGKLIAAAKPDIVVLMENSAKPHILSGLEQGGYSGEVRIQDDPLHFYNELPQFIAAGDVVLMQNDWTDNYA